MTLSSINPETGREGENTLFLSVVAGYYGTDDGKPHGPQTRKGKQNVHTRFYIYFLWNH